MKMLEYLPVAVILLIIVAIMRTNTQQLEKQRVERWVSVNIEPDREFDNMRTERHRRLTEGTFYHEIDTLSNGARVGQLGVLTYLIDSDGNIFWVSQDRTENNE